MFCVLRFVFFLSEKLIKNKVVIKRETNQQDAKEDVYFRESEDTERMMKREMSLSKEERRRRKEITSECTLSSSWMKRMS